MTHSFIITSAPQNRVFQSLSHGELLHEITKELLKLVYTQNNYENSCQFIRRGGVGMEKLRNSQGGMGHMFPREHFEKLLQF